MSDTILRMHAVDPDFAPERETAAWTEQAARGLFPGADQIDVEVYEHVTMIDCGENLERIACPHCRAEVSYDWWDDQLEAHSIDGGWETAQVDAPLVAPCCGREVTLRTLVYDWPVGFARFTVDVWNPEPWPADNDAQEPADRLGRSIGVPLRGLWAHI